MTTKVSASEFGQNNFSLRVIIAMNIAVIAIITAAVVSAILYINIRQNMEDQFSKRALNLVTLAALAQQGDLHSQVKKTGDENSSAYQSISKKNLAIVNADAIIGAVYTMRQDEQKNIYFVVYSGQKSLSDKGKSNPGIGETVTNASPTLKNEFQTLASSQIEINSRHDQWGNWLSAYAPFYQNGSQKLEGIVGIDINKDELTTLESNILILIVEIFALLIPFLVLIGWFLSTHFTKPIIRLTNAVSNILDGDFSQHIAITDNYEINLLSEAINNLAKKTSSSFSAMDANLSENEIKLEKYKKEFDNIEKQTSKQANQLKTLGTIARTILSTQNLDNILPRITAIIGDELSFYHVAIFLLDNAKEYAVLTATNSAGGQKMLKRNHRLKVGDEGIIGYAAGIARPCIALDTSKDAVFLPNPDLPETHSELAVPLKIGLDIIGILDIQSKEFSAFTEEDIEVFSTLADYISIAIQNGQRFQEIQKTITESDTLYRNYLRQEWKSFTNQRRNPGYLYNISGSKPITKKLESAEIQQAIQSGKPTISQEKAQSRLSVPIKLRGQVIGILNIQSGSSHAWEEDEIDIATAIADRVGLAVENARLLEDSQSRVARERTIGEITSKIGASINIRNVLQTAVEELGHILPGSDVIIQLQGTKDKE